MKFFLHFRNLITLIKIKRFAITTRWQGFFSQIKENKPKSKKTQKKEISGASHDQSNSSVDSFGDKPEALNDMKKLKIDSKSQSFTNSYTDTQSITPSSILDDSSDLNNVLRNSRGSIPKFLNEFGDHETSNDSLPKISRYQQLKSKGKLGDNLFENISYLLSESHPNNSLISIFNGSAFIINSFDSQSIIFDNEPSSIIAQVLSSSIYKKDLKLLQTSFPTTPKTTLIPHNLTQFKIDENNTQQKSNENSPPKSSFPYEYSPVSSPLTGISFDQNTSFEKDGNNFNLRNSTNETPQQSSNNEKKGFFEIFDEEQIQTIKNQLLFKNKAPLDHTIKSNKVKSHTIIYFPVQFDALRKIYCSNDDNFISSLIRCKEWNAEGGKSKSAFSKTFDDRFILKEVSKIELEFFVQFGEEYFKYMYKTIWRETPTILTKIFGIFTLNYNNNGKVFKQDMIIMENLFFKKKISAVILLYIFLNKFKFHKFPDL